MLPGHEVFLFFFGLTTPPKKQCSCLFFCCFVGVCGVFLLEKKKNMFLGKSNVFLQQC